MRFCRLVYGVVEGFLHSFETLPGYTVRASHAPRVFPSMLLVHLA